MAQRIPKRVLDLLDFPRPSPGKTLVWDPEGHLINSETGVQGPPGPPGVAFGGDASEEIAGLWVGSEAPPDSTWLWVYVPPLCVSISVPPARLRLTGASPQASEIPYRVSALPARLAVVGVVPLTTA